MTKGLIHLLLFQTKSSEESEEQLSGNHIQDITAAREVDQSRNLELPEVLLQEAILIFDIDVARSDAFLDDINKDAPHLANSLDEVDGTGNSKTDDFEDALGNIASVAAGEQLSNADDLVSLFLDEIDKWPEESRQRCRKTIDLLFDEGHDLIEDRLKRRLGLEELNDFDHPFRKKALDKVRVLLNEFFKSLHTLFDFLDLGGNCGKIEFTTDNLDREEDNDTDRTASHCRHDKIFDEADGGTNVSKRLTDLPGSSAYYPGGVCSYSNQVKINVLGVDAKLIETNGAVDPQVAEQMARGVARVIEADIGVGITGIAGPGGGTPEKPVGLVYLAVVWGDTVKARTLHSGLGRDFVRNQAATAALDLVRRIVIENPSVSKTV